MATQQSTVDSLLKYLAGAGEVSAKKMFGEYGLYLDGKMFGMVCDDTFFVKPTVGNVELASDLDHAPPYPSAKPCIMVPVSRWPDSEWLAELISVTASDLPVPKPKSVNGKK